MMAQDRARGTSPPGTSDEHQAAAWVRGMFSGIAPKYDLINHLLSFNGDRSWRKRLIERMRPVLDRKDATVLDLCCGTGDVTLDLAAVSEARVIGADFCHPMLIVARQKLAQKSYASLLMEADALQLPIANNLIDAVSIAFGFRNLANYKAGLAELNRVLKPGGLLAILEFSQPRPWPIKIGYGLYSKLFMPWIGALVSGSWDAYAYLPESIGKFPRAAQLAEMMADAGFAQTTFELLTGGIAALHLGFKSALIPAVEPAVDVVAETEVSHQT